MVSAVGPLPSGVPRDEVLMQGHNASRAPKSGPMVSDKVTKWVTYEDGEYDHKLLQAH